MIKKTYPTKILFASRNRGKATEVSSLLNEKFNVISLADIASLSGIEFEETGETFRENSEGKALFYHSLTNLPTIADDSGLMVRAFGNKPGVLSARWAGKNATDEQKCKKILKEMEKTDAEERTAAFVCSASFSHDGRIIKTIEERVEGLITTEILGSSGFGYDPIFFYPQLERTFAQISKEEKNRISHRGKAFSEMANFLMEYFSI